MFPFARLATAIHLPPLLLYCQAPIHHLQGARLLPAMYLGRGSKTSSSCIANRQPCLPPHPSHLPSYPLDGSRRSISLTITNHHYLAIHCYPVICYYLAIHHYPVIHAANHTIPPPTLCLSHLTLRNLPDLLSCTDIFYLIYEQLNILQQQVCTLQLAASLPWVHLLRWRDHLDADPCHGIILPHHFLLKRRSILWVVGTSSLEAELCPSSASFVVLIVPASPTSPDSSLQCLGAA